MSEQKEHQQIEYPFGKKLYAEFNGNSRDTVVKLDGQEIPRLREITVSSGLGEETVELEIVHLPSCGTITVSGYLIEESDWHILQAAKRARVRG